jgi:transcriptional regulator with PAS, ATPase and Fis domain
MKIDNYKEMLELILDHSHEGVVLCDPQGKIRYFNRIYGETFHLRSVRDVGKHITEIFPDARIPSVAQTGIPEFGVIYLWNGQKLVVNRIPVKEKGKVIGVITQVLFRDIQELRELHEKVNFLQTKIISIGAEFRQFFQAKYTLDDIIGESDQTQQLKSQIIKHAQSSLPVLILGESGTGKELCAHALHRLSLRSKRAFMAINCAAIPKELMESELFGYEQGAFTGAAPKGRIGKLELVEGGTLFFDEIGDMPLEMQAKILRVIEEKEVTKVGGSKPVPVSFALIAASNRDIESLVQKGGFRSDLYYRINTCVLKIPPLRERKEDILSIVQHLVLSSECNPTKKPVGFSEEVLQALIDHDWPGNIRELKNLVNFAVNNLAREERLVQLNHLPLSFLKTRKESSLLNSPLPFKKAMLDRGKEIIQEALKATSGNKMAAAKLLGISRSVLYEKLDS